MTNFEEIFAHRPEIETSVHGRLNLIGEHTDYNSGLALPIGIPQSTHAQLRARPDKKVRLLSLNVQGVARRFEYELGNETKQGTWADSVQGITLALNREGFPLMGFDALIDSEIPMGSGLASGAALEVAVLKGLSLLYELQLDGVHVAELARRAENDFLGTRFGIMNPLAVSLGRLNEALLIDTADRSYKRIPLPVEKMELIVMNSGLNHSHWNQGQKKRRAECQEACARLGVRDLRQLEIDDLSRLHEELPDTLLRRVRHVITENVRVREAAQALLQGNIRRLGDILDLSHQSLLRDYEVSLPPIDLLVKLAMVHTEVYGARLLGSGFGGSIVILAEPGVAMRITEHVQDEYHHRTGLYASVLIPPTTPAALRQRQATAPQQWLI